MVEGGFRVDFGEGGAERAEAEGKGLALLAAREEPLEKEYERVGGGFRRSMRVDVVLWLCSDGARLKDETAWKQLLG